ncbi:MAG: twin-arginine translocation signal domain-containing protein, partial [Pirellulaceae bacterium]
MTAAPFGGGIMQRHRRSIPAGGAPGLIERRATIVTRQMGRRELLKSALAATAATGLSGVAS